MEHRKVLLVIVSVTILLAAIVGVGLWLFYPRDAVDPDSIAGAAGGLEWEPLDFLRGDGVLPGLDEAEPDEDDGEFIVTYGVTAPVQTAARPDARFVTEQPAAPDVPPPVAIPPRRDETPVRAPAAVAPAADSRVAARASEPTPATPSPQPPSRPGPAPVLADRAYWVQMISSPNRDTVEQAQRTLREYQLGTRILTREIGGTTYFRLRLGPFAVREEAEKFLGWIVNIDGFSDSMIFVDYTTAVLAAQSR